MQYESKKIVDFYKLGLNKKMINNINYIKNEIEVFIDNKNNIEENIVALLNYYVEIIIKDGINITRKKINLERIKNIDDNYNELIDLYKYKNMDILINQIKNNNDKIDIINFIIFYCIKLYKHSQLLEFKLNNFNNIRLNSISDCCELCKVKSKFKNTINELIGDIHPFCKNNYFINIDESYVNTFLEKMKAIIPKYIKDINIKLLNKIDFNCIDSLDESQKEKITTIDDYIISYFNNNELLINKNKCNDIYHTILLNAFDFNFENEILDWFKNKYNDKIKYKNIINDIVIYKNPFISFISEISYMDYLKESIIYYIIDKEKLLKFDKDVFNYIKENIFNNIEFR